MFTSSINIHADLPALAVNNDFLVFSSLFSIVNYVTKLVVYAENIK